VVMSAARLVASSCLSERTERMGGGANRMCAWEVRENRLGYIQNEEGKGRN
jgi:hypothetical protein